jgi:hypothetical protein
MTAGAKSRGKPRPTSPQTKLATSDTVTSSRRSVSMIWARLLAYMKRLSND